MTNGNDKSLESWIWDAACSIRGAKDAPKFKDYIVRRFAGLTAVCVCLSLATEVRAQVPRATPDLDRKVQGFLDAERDKWDYLNVPYQDGKILHDLVVKGAHKAILE